MARKDYFAARDQMCILIVVKYQEEEAADDEAYSREGASLEAAELIKEANYLSDKEGATSERRTGPAQIKK